MNREYTHTLSTNMVKILQAMPTHTDFIMSKIGLTHVQVANSHKLRYWGLIEKSHGAYWTVTRLGNEFLLGITQIYDRVHTLNGKRTRFSGVLLFIHNIIDMPYKSRQDYIDTSCLVSTEDGQLGLF